MHLLKLALRPWRATAPLQLFSAFFVALTLFSSGLMAWLGFSLEPVSKRLSSEHVITAYIEPEVVKDDEPRLVEAIRDSIQTSLGARAIGELKLVRPLEFIAQVRDEYADLADQLEGLGGSELDTIVPRYVSVSGTFEPATAEVLRSIKGIDLVETSVNKRAVLAGSVSALRWVTTLAALVLFVGAWAFMVHVGKSNAQQFGEASAFLKLMGGGSLRSHLPCFLSCMVFGGVVGALTAGFWFFGAGPLFFKIREISLIAPVFSELPMIPRMGAGLLGLIGLGLGLFSGVWVGLFARGRAPVGGRAWL